MRVWQKRVSLLGATLLLPALAACSAPRDDGAMDALTTVARPDAADVPVTRNLDAPAGSADLSPDTSPDTPGLEVEPTDKPLECPAGFHACGRVCVDSASPQHCGVACEPCPALPGGTVTCDGVKCGAMCPAGTKLCEDRCVDENAPCMNKCKEGKNFCNGTCVLPTEPTACGTGCTRCPVPEGGRAVCAAGRCDFECPGKRRCGDRCIALVSESCGNGSDDDCDGKIDCADSDCVGKTCGSGKICEGSACVTQCGDGPGQPCCEGTKQPCETACGNGQQTCSGGRYTSCSAPKPGTEVCNGRDDDCDDDVDEGSLCPSGQSCRGASGCKNNCVPRTCADLGWNCGSGSDGCGGTLNCGGCGSGQRCEEHACVANCVPKTCASQGWECGSAQDGCGGVISCGSCQNGNTCNSQNTCAGCIPKSCESRGLECGNASNGCGTIINCGTCPAGVTCQLGKCVCEKKSCPITAQCGTVDDGCGGKVSCGQCPLGQKCTNNRCS